jgi:hypothetical protein
VHAQGFGAAASSASPGTRFSVELPLASDSPAELAGLALDLLAALPAAATAGANIVCASQQVAAAVQATRSSSSSSGRQGDGPVLSLRAACQADSLSGPLLLVAPATSDVSAAGLEGRGTLHPACSSAMCDCTHGAACLVSAGAAAQSCLKH